MIALQKLNSETNTMKYGYHNTLDVGAAEKLLGLLDNQEVLNNKEKKILQQRILGTTVKDISKEYKGGQYSVYCALGKLIDHSKGMGKVIYEWKGEFTQSYSKFRAERTKDGNNRRIKNEKMLEERLKPKKHIKKQKTNNTIRFPSYMTPEMGEYIINFKESFPEYSHKEFTMSLNAEFKDKTFTKNIVNNLLVPIHKCIPEIRSRERRFFRLPKEREVFIEKLLLSGVKGWKAVGAYRKRYPDQNYSAVNSLMHKVSMKNNSAIRNRLNRSKEKRTKKMNHYVSKILETHYFNASDIAKKVTSLKCFGELKIYPLIRHINHMISKRGWNHHYYEGFSGMKIEDLEDSFESIRKTSLLSRRDSDLFRKRLLERKNLDDIGDAKKLTRERVRQICENSLPVFLAYHHLSEKLRERYSGLKGKELLKIVNGNNGSTKGI